MELVIFMGLQAAGKTTFYAQRFAATHTLVSKDLLRNNPRPERRRAQLIGEALAAGQSVVVDNTNATLVHRAELVALGHQNGALIVGYQTSRLRAPALRHGDESRVAPVGYDGPLFSTVVLNSAHAGGR
jgi:hypothetical protein